MSKDILNGHLLAEKLSKLNSSQQSIQSLSQWCISHPKKAKLIVETWDKLFNSSQREQRVSFLYLANDILQNSRRKGSEFVNEFWKVLPAALKHVHNNGDENGKKVAFRLIDIWEERKVFGSRGQSLKDEILGKVPPSSVSNGKGVNPIKIVKRDAHSVRIKLAVGAMPEKLLTAFQAVQEEHLKEEVVLNNCKAAVHYVTRVADDIEKSITQGDKQGSTFVDELQKQENILHQCVGEFESAEATRAALASRLREALQDQESELELVRSQLQVAKIQIEQARDMRKRLTSPPGNPTATTNVPTEVMRVAEPNLSSAQSTSTPPPALSQPMMSFAPVTEEEKKRAAVAAVAAKLTASTSCAQMLTSVLSSLVAEEAAAMNGGSKLASLSPDLPMFSAVKRQKLEKPMSVSDVSNSDVGATAYISPLQQQTVTSVPPAPPTSMQPMSQSNQLQPTFPPPPPPPLSPANQFGQTAGLMVGVMPYGYSPNTLPPPPPLPPHVTMGLARPVPLPPQQPQQQLQTTGGYYCPPGIGFYGQSHQPSPPPVPRQ